MPGTRLRRVASIALLVGSAMLSPLAAQEAEPFIQVIPRAEVGAVAVLKQICRTDARDTRSNNGDVQIFLVF